MAYDMVWGSNHPGHLVFLLDLSGSMESNGKIDYLLKATKDTVDALIWKCYQGQELKNRFSVSIIGYNSEVRPLFKGSVVDLNNKLDEVYNQGGEEAPLFDKTKEAKPKGRADMAKAFRAAAGDIREWMTTQQGQGIQMPAPIVVHITDGSLSEADSGVLESNENILQAAEEIKQISLPDGNPILVNILVEDELWFPSQCPNDSKKQLLYEISSVIPDGFWICPTTHLNNTHICKYYSEEGCRFFSDVSHRFMVSNVKNTGFVGQILARMIWSHGCYRYYGL